MSAPPMSHDEAINQAKALVPLFRSEARHCEILRRPSDKIIDAMRESGLYALMVPKAYGGHELGLDTYFEVGLLLSEADASLGWVNAFYIEHNLWALHYPKSVTDRLFEDRNYILAPATLNLGGGTAKKVEGGYRLNGQWSWGTGITHADWVMAGALEKQEDKPPIPKFFLLPAEQVQKIDSWYVNGMSGTGSLDFKIENQFVEEAYTVPFLDLMTLNSGIKERFSGALYRTPLMPFLGLVASIPILGAARHVIKGFCEQTRSKLEEGVLRGGGVESHVPHEVITSSELDIQLAEVSIRKVMRELMEEGESADETQRSQWLTRLTHSVFMCREAASNVSQEMGASGGKLDNPVQRAIRDINIAANHIVFARQARYGDYSRALLGQPLKNLMV